MSTLKIDELKNNGSAIDLPNGIKVGGNEIVQGYTSSGTEPASPVTGDFWWDSTNELLYQYLNGEFKEIGTVAPRMDISAFSYDNVSFSPSVISNPVSLSFNSDGTSLIVGNNSNDTAYAFPLSTSSDLSTASTSSTSSVSVSSQSGSPSHFDFNDDGSKMYVMDYSSASIYQYTLSTPYVLSTASYDSVSFSSGVVQPWGMTLSPDGSKLFIANFGDDVRQYSLSTPFDLSTISYDSVLIDIGTEDSTPRFVQFSQNGLQMFAGGSSSGSIHQYTLTTAFDVSTASYDNVSLSLSAQAGATPSSITFSPDFTKLYVGSDTNDAIYQYSIA